MRNLLTLFILLGFGLNGYAQSNDVLAKSYFLKAQENYSEGNNASAMENLDKTLDYLGSTNAKIEALYVKIALKQNDYIEAETHLNSYFEIADESRSDYMEMLSLIPRVKEIQDFVDNINITDYVFREGLAIIELNNKYGYINKSGAVVTPIKYDHALNFKDGLASVRLNSKWAFINKNGKEITPFKYDGVEQQVANNGIFQVYINENNDKKWGFIDRNGKEIVSPKYDDYFLFVEGFSRVTLKGQVSFIDTSGKLLIPFFKYYFVYNFSEGMALVGHKGTGNALIYGYIDKTGKEIIPVKYPIAHDFKNGQAMVLTSINGEWIKINKLGRRVE